MAKNTDLFIGQQCLLKGWITPAQLSECMKILPRYPHFSLTEILLRKNYLKKEDGVLLEGLWHERCLTKKQNVVCSFCHKENTIEDYEPDQVYLCSQCQQELAPSPFVREDPKKKAPAPAPAPKEEDSELSLNPPDFGPYKILSEIGRGGMGIVYKVKHNDIDFPLALKILMQQQGDGGENVMRFFREIELASKLRHPNIIGIHDVGVCNGCPYYTMDYIEGQTLDKILKRKERFSEMNATQIVEKVALALAAAHKAQIIHRDIKPANIMIDKENRVYLMDFGIATCRDKIFKKLTRTGTIMGTPDYMPPEQASGKTNLIHYQSDVYSLGATFYHLLTGFPPFEGRTPIETITKVIAGAPIPVRQRKSSISPRTEAVLMKAMAYSLEDRYANATLFHMDLIALLTGGPTIARGESFWKKQKRFLRKNWIIGVCILVSILALLATTVILWKVIQG